MNRGILSKWGLMAGAALLPLTVGRLPGESGVLPNTPTVVDPETVPAASAEGDFLSTNDGADALFEAPVTPVSQAKPLPPNLRTSGPLLEIIKLADSGVGENVLLAFVANSTSRFNLGADEIIYLSDIGVPGGVVTAMLQRDQRIAQDGAAAQTALPNPLPGGEVPPQFADTEGGPPTEVAPAPAEEMTDTTFTDSLAPYGNWVDVGGYGRCWQPTVMLANPGWQPYSDCGRWIYSDCGWYWLSDYSWGWAPFHYGRWFRHHQLGWCWAPGRVWAPSWVCWRYTGDYCGWAPLPPGAGFAVGLGLTFHGRRADPGCDFGLRAEHFRFVSWGHFTDRHVRHFDLAGQASAGIFVRSLVASGITERDHRVVNHGIAPERVAAAMHSPVHTVVLRTESRIGTASGPAEHFDVARQRPSVFRPETRPTGQVMPSVMPSAHRNGRDQVSARSPSPALSPNRNPVNTSTPLIVRGREVVSAPDFGTREPGPGNSLIVIGHKEGNRPVAFNAATGFAQMQRAPDTTPVSPHESPLQNSAATIRNERPQIARRIEAGRAPSGLDSRSVTPSAAPRQSWMPSSQVPVRTAPAEVSRFAPTPTVAPQRSYSAAMPSAPRPSVSEAPRYSPPTAVSAPSGGGSRPTPSAAPASSGAGRSSR